MPTMLYEAETLEPCLLVSENITDNDVDKEFYVINGHWRGVFNKGKITINHPEYRDNIAHRNHKCYSFDDCEEKSYMDRFADFRGLVEQGVIK